MVDRQTMLIPDHNQPDAYRGRVIVVSYGGGVNSTAMLIALQMMGIKPHAILFADTGGEMPHTYEFVPKFNRWLVENGMPSITTVKYDSHHGTLERECLNNETLPSKAFGFAGCSVKWKRQPMDKWIKNDPVCAEEIASGRKIVRFIGIHYGETRRGKIPDTDQFEYVYPLRGLQWRQKQCVEAIERTGLSVPGKSACFFCPSMRVREIKNLAEQHPDLAERALAMEDNAREAGGLQTVKGLGGFTFSWGSLLRDSLPVIESTPPICDACWDGDEGGFELKG